MFPTSITSSRTCWPFAPQMLEVCTVERKQLFSLGFLTFVFHTFSDFCSEPRGGALVMCAHMHPRHRATEFQIVLQLIHQNPERGLRARYRGTVSSCVPRDRKSRQSIFFSWPLLADVTTRCRIRPGLCTGSQWSVAV